MKVHIIGGGIIGLCSAYYLHRAGIEVEVIDKGDLIDGCSHGNAGMVVPSHFVPLAAPGVISKGIKWLFDAKSPFYIRPRLNLELVHWLWQFYRSCTPEKVAKAIPILKDLNVFSKELYGDLHQQFQFAFEQKGLLMLYKSKKVGKEELEVAEKAEAMGLEARALSASEAQELEPTAGLDVLGAVYYPGDAHLHPNALMHGLQQYLIAQGVNFRTSTSISSFGSHNGKLDYLVTDQEDQIPVEQVVLAAGSWSAKLLKAIGLRLLLQDGKGYSVTMNRTETSPQIPAILTEAKVAITPMSTYLRIGGTLEISNFNPNLNQKRLAGILEAVPRYYKNLEPIAETGPVWHGFRPCTPDGLPYIGRSKTFENLTIATGHAMMGLSLGPATGKLVSEILTHTNPSLAIDAYQPERY